MPQDAVPNLQADADQLEAATDQAIAACGGNAREAVRALIVANEYLESEVCELMQAVARLRAGKVQDLYGLKRWKTKRTTTARASISLSAPSAL
jgi:hypothetical protein